MDSRTVIEDRVKQLRNNVNDNVGNKLPNNVNDNVKPPGRTENQVNAIAARLVDALDNPDARLFYCKVAWQLSEAQIQNNLEIALRSHRSPQRYFTWLCKRMMSSL